MKLRKHLISRVLPDSIAEELGLEPGDRLISVNAGGSAGKPDLSRPDRRMGKPPDRDCQGQCRRGRVHGRNMGRYADKVQLAFGRLESIAHIAVSVSEVTVVVQVAPEYFQVACRRHNLLCFFTSCHARAEQASRSCQSQKRPACVF